MLRAKGLAALAVALGTVAEARSNDFFGPIFATPIRNAPGTTVPPGSVLNAPVITPVGSKHGSTIFEVTPMGRDADSIFTRHPEQHLAATRECTGWLTAEFLYWATQGPNAPPLVQNGPVILPPGALPFAVLTATQTLLGGERILNGMRPGFRISAGAFIDDAKDWAVSHTIISIGSRSERLVGGSDGTNIVNLPQTNIVLGVPVQTPLYVGYPGLTRGTVAASVQTSLYSGDTHLRRVFQSGTGFRFDLLAGYRFLYLGDSIRESFDVVSATLPGAISPRLMGEQSARTRNMFDGGEAGFQFQGRVGKLTFDWLSTLALGATSTEIDRSFTRSFLGGVGTLPGVPLPPGGVALTQSGGRTKQTEFAAVPQIGLKLGWEPTDHVRITAGYDFIYWSRVRRAPELFTGNDVVTDFWAQGVSAGLEFRY